MSQANALTYTLLYPVEMRAATRLGEIGGDHH